MKQHTKQAAALLPCKVCDEPTNRYRGRWHRCPVKYRPAVVAALQQQYESGWNDGSKSALEARYPGMEAALAEKDERIAQLERSNEFITRCFDEREKALADAYTKCGQLKERVAELEGKLEKQNESE